MFNGGENTGREVRRDHRGQRRLDQRLHDARLHRLPRELPAAGARARALARGRPHARARDHAEEPRAGARHREGGAAPAHRRRSRRQRSTRRSTSRPTPPAPTAGGRSASWPTSTRSRSRTPRATSAPTTRRTTRRSCSPARCRRQRASRSRSATSATSRAQTPPPPVVNVEPPQGGPKTLEFHKVAELPAVAIAYKAVNARHPDRPALDVLQAILGHGQSSRLYRSIVREKELASDVDVSFNWGIDQELFWSERPGASREDREGAGAGDRGRDRQAPRPARPTSASSARPRTFSRPTTCAA